MFFRSTAFLLLAGLSAWSGGLPRSSFVDTAGGKHPAAEWASKKAVVLFFSSTDCPLANAYVPEMNRMQQAYASRGVAFYAVQGDATIAAPEVIRHAREFSFTFPYLFDPDEALATYTGAIAVPSVAVLSPRGDLLYLGRIDNRQEDFGKQRPQATVFDLRDALDAVLSGKPVPHPRTKALGCSIVRKS
jgi:thiol-disulfide isomerase/thioredoxin